MTAYPARVPTALHLVAWLRRISARPILLGLVVALGAAGFCGRLAAADPSPPSALTVILIRHGEKAVVAQGTPIEKQDPDLAPAGRERAQELVRVLGDAGISAIYATHFKRTQQTVRPLAEKLGLTPTVLDAGANAELASKIRARSPGSVVLVAGHDASLPEVIAALGGPKVPIISATVFDHLYVLTVPAEGNPLLVKLRYGQPTGP